MPAESTLKGLSSAEAGERLSRYGPNTVREADSHPWLAFLKKFWSPIPWMLEITIALQLALGKADEAQIIAALLLFNAILSFVQENRANKALALLKGRLEIQVRVLRDGLWKKLPAQELVPGDVVHLRMGDLVPADISLLDGQILLDQSALTGESLPIEAGQGTTAYAGAIVKRGEASGEVAATGSRTYFGRTAELVRTAKTASHLEKLIFSIVRYLIALDVVLVSALLAYTMVSGIAIAEVIPFALILLVASVPIALPATFTLATALGSLELAKNGVLVTRLAAIEEAAAMDVLASDKTGTITQNRLALTALHSFGAHPEADLLRLAGLACDDATQDPIDIAILDAARSRGRLDDIPRRLGFVPFDPETKRSEALFEEAEGKLHVIKGAPMVVAGLVAGKPDIAADVERMGAQGLRVLAVAAGREDSLALVGLVGLKDPPREDSRLLIKSLNDLGVRVMMVTGDGPATARAIAEEVGLGMRVCPPEALQEEIARHVLDYDVFAHVLPEDKFHMV